jgi:hypothetical protein
VAGLLASRAIAVLSVIRNSALHLTCSLDLNLSLFVNNLAKNTNGKCFNKLFQMLKTLKYTIN